VLAPLGVGIGRDGTAANTQIFVNAFNAINGDGRFKKHDFTVKADPDAVLIPDRLRVKVAPHIGKNVYFQNCDLRSKYPGTTAYPMMYGAVEAITKEGLKAYRDGYQRCKDIFGAWWQSWGEDLFLGKCLPQLGVSPRDDFGIVNDALCHNDKWCGNGWSAAFHPFKDVGSWMGCWWTVIGGGKPKPALPEL